MNETILLIDHENVSKVDLNDVPDGMWVYFFFGASQQNVPRTLMKAAHRLGERFVDIDIEGHGKNALDFHIAFYLGEHLAKKPGTEGIILSKDKGFDPLVKHLRGRKLDVRRANSLAEAFKIAKPAAKAPAVKPVDVGHVISFLASNEKTKRPHKRDKLIAHLINHFRKQNLSADGAASLVEKLCGARKLTEVGGKLAYHF
jgi:hypothetical protein